MAELKKRLNLPAPENDFEKGLETELLREWLRLHEILTNGQFKKLQIADGITAPDTISGYASIYVDTADNSLKVKFGNGTVKTITTNP